MSLALRKGRRAQSRRPVSQIRAGMRVSSIVVKLRAAVTSMIQNRRGDRFSVYRAYGHSMAPEDIE